MTRKEEIRWPLQAQIDLVKARIDYYSKEPLCSSEVGKHNLSIWKSTLNTLELTAPESSPAPLISKEELLKDKPYHNDEGYDAGYQDAVNYIQSKFILTRRTEEKGRTEWKEIRKKIADAMYYVPPFQFFENPTNKDEQEELWKEIEDDEHILWNYKQATIERLKKNYVLSRRQVSGAGEKVSPDLEKFHDLERNDSHNQ